MGRGIARLGLLFLLLPPSSILSCSIMCGMKRERLGGAFGGRLYCLPASVLLVMQQHGSHQQGRGGIRDSSCERQSARNRFRESLCVLKIGTCDRRIAALISCRSVVRYDGNQSPAL